MDLQNNTCKSKLDLRCLLIFVLSRTVSLNEYRNVERLHQTFPPLSVYMRISNFPCSDDETTTRNLEPWTIQRIFRSRGSYHCRHHHDDLQQKAISWSLLLCLHQHVFSSSFHQQQRRNVHLPQNQTMDRHYVSSSVCLSFWACRMAMMWVDLEACPSSCWW